MIRMHGKGAVDINHNKGRYRPDNDGFISVPPELVSALENLGFTRVPDAPIPALAPGPARETRTDDELLAAYTEEANARGYKGPAAAHIAQARLKALREDIPYDEASRQLSAAAEVQTPAANPPVLIPDIAVDGPPELSEEEKAIARSVRIEQLIAEGKSQDEALAIVDAVPEQVEAVATTTEVTGSIAVDIPVALDPEELERQKLFDELVAGGSDPAEARALVWDLPEK